jgi:hypothetical protein
MSRLRRAVVLDRAVGLTQRELSIAEADDAADHVDVRVVKGLHERAGIFDVPRLRARELGDRRVVEHAPHAVLEVDDGGVHARPSQHADHALDAVQADVRARDVEAGRALHALGEMVVVRRLRQGRGRPHRGHGDDRQTERRCEEPPAHAPMVARAVCGGQQSARASAVEDPLNGARARPRRALRGPPARPPRAR